MAIEQHQHAHELLTATDEQRGKLLSLDLSNYLIIYHPRFKDLCNVLGSCQSLESLNLHNSDLSRLLLDEKSIQALCNALVNCHKLKFLDLSCTNLHYLDAKKFRDLCYALSRCKSLQTLDFQHINLGILDETQFQVFCNALVDCQKLQTIKLKFDSLDSVKLEALSTAFSRCHSLQTLYLADNKLEKLDTASFKEFCNALSRCQSLQTLDLGRINLGIIGETQFQDFCNTLINCPNLQTIKLKIDTLDSVKLETLFNALARCKSLQTLNLRANNIGNLGEARFKVFCNGISRLSRMQTLNFFGASLMSLDLASIQNLFIALSGCQGLKTLNLGFNSFGCFDDFKKFKTLCDFIACNQSLEALNLESNYFEYLNEKFLEALCTALDKCKNLLVLNINGNDISQEQIDVLQEPIEKHKRAKNGAMLMAITELINKYGIKVADVVGASEERLSLINGVRSLIRLPSSLRLIFICQIADSSSLRIDCYYKQALNQLEPLFVKRHRHLERMRKADGDRQIYSFKVGTNVSYNGDNPDADANGVDKKGSLSALK